MVRLAQWSASLLLVVACRPSEASTTPTEDVEARANEVRGRLLAKCKAGDESACRRIAVSPGTMPVEQAPEQPAADATGTDDEPVGVVFGSFPDFVGGLPSYGTPQQVADSCAQGGGTFFAFRGVGGDIPVDQVADGDIVACLPPPIDPFGTFNETTGIGVKFCELEGPIACEMTFIMRDRGHADAKELLARLESKYGHGGDYPPDFSCADPQEAAMEYRRTWGIIEEVEGKKTVAGRIVTGYFCEVREPGGRAALALVYQNALGYMRRVEESKQRSENF